jgi:hypothetical protein
MTTSALPARLPVIEGLGDFARPHRANQGAQRLGGFGSLAGRVVVPTGAAGLECRPVEPRCLGTHPQVLEVPPC